MPKAIAIRMPAARPARCVRLSLLACCVGAAIACTGCVQSARHSYLTLRADAPRPERGDRATLAEALPSNVGPTAPPTALVDATGH